MIVVAILLAAAATGAWLLCSTWKRTVGPSGGAAVEVFPEEIPMKVLGPKRAVGNATVYNPGSGLAYVSAWVEGIEGTVSPHSFTLGPGGSVRIEVETAVPPPAQLHASDRYLVVDYGSGQVRVPLMYPPPPGGGPTSAGSEQGPGEESSQQPPEEPQGTSASLTIALYLKIEGGPASATMPLPDGGTMQIEGSFVREEEITLKVNLTPVGGSGGATTYQGTGKLYLNRLTVTGEQREYMDSPTARCKTNRTLSFNYEGVWDVLVYVVLDDEGKIVDLEVNNLPDASPDARIPNDVEVTWVGATRCLNKLTGLSASSAHTKAQNMGMYLEEHLELLLEWVGPLEFGSKNDIALSLQAPWEGLESLVGVWPAADVTFHITGFVLVGAD